MKLKFSSKKIVIASLVLMTFLAEGCASSGQGMKSAGKKGKAGSDDEVKTVQIWTPDEISAAQSQWSNRAKVEGSTWNDTYSSRLFDNMYRASKIGDTLMIVVTENASATNNATTKADKKTEHDASIDHLGGLMSKLSSLISGLNPANLINAKTESKFDGKGTTSRSGQLAARLTGRVMQVYPNGNMDIRAEQHIKINEEEQVLVVEGQIRPYDILPNNTIPSNAIADARISYKGYGVVARRQKPGWLVQALDYIWPF